ncbi:hypothetical protein BaRGS_00025996 [Batillaria attramentaria]|uniref:Uncharacterized protein n=1 Tax=Batillaria attramentaria TaxID=370345 RepID=A0ABD0K784_9CAEN
MPFAGDAKIGVSSQPVARDLFHSQWPNPWTVVTNAESKCNCGTPPPSCFNCETTHRREDDTSIVILSSGQILE